jgi:D-amino-acid dehydrogenase
MSRHLVILGAGVAGLCAAYFAQRRGWRVTVIERGAVRRDGCSYGNAGMVVPSHFIPLAAPGMVALGLRWMFDGESPFYIRPRLDFELAAWALRFWRAATPQHVRRAAPLLRDLSLASRAAFVELGALGFGLETRGLLMLCKSAEALEEEAGTAAHARALGVPAEVLDARAAAALDPGVTMDIAGAVYFPRDCQLDPGRFMDALQREVAAGGAEFLWETTATGWRHDIWRLQAVQTTRGDVAGDEFLLAGGVWSAALVRELGLRVPMQAGKGYSLTLAQPRQLPKICAIFTEARVAVTPMGGALRVGGTMEIAGLDESITARRVQGIIKAVPEYYPAFAAEDFAGVVPWRGLRPCSPDGLPYLGRTAAYENLLIATGHAMMGLSLGPVTGQIIAALLDREPPGHDLALLDPDRYA